jgi:hypothetical protein
VPQPAHVVGGKDGRSDFWRTYFARFLQDLEQ